MVLIFRLQLFLTSPIPQANDEATRLLEPTHRKMDGVGAEGD